MCGITGAVWTRREKALDPQTLQGMIDVLAHRGADREGSYRAELRLQPGRATSPGVALGHRRLAIIDVAGGKQPMANEDGSLWPVFDQSFNRVRCGTERTRTS